MINWSNSTTSHENAKLANKASNAEDLTIITIPLTIQKVTPGNHEDFNEDSNDTTITHVSPVQSARRTLKIIIYDNVDNVASNNNNNNFININQTGNHSINHNDDDDLNDKYNDK